MVQGAMPLGAVQVKGQAYDSRAVRNLVRLTKHVMRTGRELEVEVVI